MLGHISLLLELGHDHAPGEVLESQGGVAAVFRLLSTYARLPPVTTDGNNLSLGFYWCISISLLIRSGGANYKNYGRQVPIPNLKDLL